LGLRALLDQRIGTLSLGQRRRACLAAALTGRPWLLVLDEPTNGLDAEGTDSLARTLERHVAGGGIAVVATHDVAFCERVARGAAPWRCGGGGSCAFFGTVRTASSPAAAPLAMRTVPLPSAMVSPIADTALSFEVSETSCRSLNRDAAAPASNVARATFAPS